MLNPAESSQGSPSQAVPFDAARLDRLMDERRNDVEIATSKHNVQYLLGGHRSLLLDYMDATDVTRYLPVFVYARGGLDKAAYFGDRLEGFQRQVKPFWVPEQQTSASDTIDAIRQGIDYIRRAGFDTRRIAV